VSRLLTLIVLVLAVTALVPADDFVVPAERELDDLIASAAGSPLSAATVGDVAEVRDLLLTARHQREYVYKAAALSYLYPGLGHYAIDERGAGFAFMGANLTITAASLVGAYFLLPAPVRFGNLNYLQTPLADIESRWKALTPAELLAPLGVIASGGIISAVIRSFAANNARDAAIAKLVNGEVEFSAPHGP